MKGFNKTVRSFLNQGIRIEQSDSPEETAQKLSQVLNTLTMQLNLLSCSGNEKTVNSLTFFKHESDRDKLFCDPAPITKSTGVLLRGDDFTDGLDKMTGLVFIKRKSDFLDRIFVSQKSSIPRSLSSVPTSHMWLQQQHEKVYKACLFKISSDLIKQEWPGFAPCIDGARQLTKTQDKHALGEAVSYLRVMQFANAFAVLWSNWKNEGSAGFGIFNLQMFEHFDRIITEESSIHSGVVKAFEWLNSNLQESISNLSQQGNDKGEEDKEVGTSSITNQNDESDENENSDNNSEELENNQNAEQGSDSEEQGSDSEEQGSDSEEQGSDFEEQGSDSEEQGSDSEEQGSDSEEQGSDSEEQGSEGEGSGSSSEKSSNAVTKKTVEEIAIDWVQNLDPKNYKTRIANRDLPVWEQNYEENPLRHFERGLIKPEDITPSKNMKVYLPKVDQKNYDNDIGNLSKVPVLDINLEEMVSLWRKNYFNNPHIRNVNSGSRLDLIDQDRFDLWKTNNRAAIEEVADSIYFPATEPEYPEHGYRSGDLDEAKLWEIPVQLTDGRLFSVRDITGHQKVLAILLDCSGSMGNTGPKMREACEVVKLISEAVKELSVEGLNYSVYAHTGIVVLSQDSLRDQSAFRSNPSSYNKTEMTIIRVKDKEVDQVSALMPITIGKDSQGNRETVMPFVMTDNYDGFAIDYVIKDIKNQYPLVKNDNIHLIVVSDGQPSGRFYGNSTHAVAHTSEVIQSWQDSKINIFGIGICNAMQPEIAEYLYGPNNYTIINNVVGSLPIMTEFIQRICAGE